MAKAALDGLMRLKNKHEEESRRGVRIILGKSSTQNNSDDSVDKVDDNDDNGES